MLATDGSASMVEQAKLHHPEIAAHVIYLKLPDGLSSALGVFDRIYAVAVLMHRPMQEIESTISTVILFWQQRAGLYFQFRPDGMMSSQKSLILKAGDSQHYHRVGGKIYA